ncbi:PACE efflux transporter [Seongchinamella unica]|uniref:PACE efflux transporter n=1 Tax=Seongchinamella unica TaxID=2547392 RepID=A0A4R5LVE6_9GAMM|nr:PACE efflux transporter [Seongchinamella unica]TDG15403.1 PACE efflux transporter [Seongchinamella unica]
MMSQQERLLQSVLFEALLIAMIAPLVYWLGSTEAPIEPEQALVTSLVGSGIALVMNYFYNMAFDRVFGHVRIERTLRVRLLHAVGFELSLVTTFLPFVMWYLDIGFIQALLLDIVLMGFTLVYTYIFHWVYDQLRHRYRMRNTA